MAIHGGKYVIKLVLLLQLLQYKVQILEHKQTRLIGFQAAQRLNYILQLAFDKLETKAHT